MLLFFFNDTATTEIYTLSLHDALPIFARLRLLGWVRRRSRQCLPRVRRSAHCDEDRRGAQHTRAERRRRNGQDRKSTRLNSSHANISYAVFCLKKKNHTLNTSPATTCN